MMVTLQKNQSGLHLSISLFNQGHFKVKSRSRKMRFFKEKVAQDSAGIRLLWLVWKKLSEAAPIVSKFSIGSSISKSKHSVSGKLTRNGLSVMRHG
jgi:hypothetical protein